MACATQTQFRRGIAAANAAFTGVEGEVTYATDSHRLFTHDGVTVGGFALALFSDIPTSTTSLPEGTNLYYTDVRARAALSVSSPLTYNNGTGAFAITLANGINDGYLSAADWNTFNNKQSAAAPGADGEVIFNLAGFFGSDGGFVYDNALQTLKTIALEVGSIGTPAIVFRNDGTASFFVNGFFALKILAENHIILANDGVDITDGLIQVESGFKVDGPGPLGILVVNTDTGTTFTVNGTTGQVFVTNTLDMGSAKISSLAAPVAGGDATNKTYVDAGTAGNKVFNYNSFR